DLDEINHGDHGDGSILNKLYPTNTGYSLNLAEIMNLIAAKYDFAVLLDGATGQPLNVNRMQRSANLTQRIALFASELVCSAPNCDRPQLECEVHHLDPWIRGGLTNLVNLTHQCFNHHPRNDDTRTGVNGKGFMDRDPVTGRVGHYPVGGEGPVFNRSAAAC
ncbi:HNH endonuclease signature motif containing protein, partial [Corynebacterium glutamicum]|uniref:HNH endonuclease signature motif containing protein n=1 Tax=Corynebacterium glutamicum TaxID=1718 RepID=UPI000AB47E2D